MRRPSSAAACLIAALLVAFAHNAFARADEAQPAAEQEAVAALRRVAANVQLRLDKSVWFVRLSRERAGDGQLALLPVFPRLEYLAVAGTQFTEEGLKSIAPLTSLQTLLIEDAPLTDGLFAEFGGLDKLERLYLTRTQIGDAALATIARFEKLTTLDLVGTKITDAGLVHLAGLPKLDYLDLTGTSITDAGLAHLTASPSLRVLDLTGTKITATGVAQLAAMKSLKQLMLDKTALDDSAFESLSALKQLKVLTVYNTQISADAQASLREQLPAAYVAGPPPSVAAKSAAPPANSPAVEQSPAVAKPGDMLAPARERFTAADNTDAPLFQQHVLPLLGRLGCNGRACHGSFQGQGGFRLSMFGYDFAADHEALTKGAEPRVNLQSPAESLILNKPTSEENHGGGRRFDKDGWEYQLLQRWIAAGAKGLPENAPAFVALDVTPAQLVFARPGEAVQLKAVARWSDGTREDVTGLCRFQSNDDSVADVDLDGLVRAKGTGDTSIITFYDNGVSSTEVILPVSDRTGENYPEVPTPTRIDELVVAKLAKLGVVPSKLCSDEDFLRRISLDLVGSLPTPEEIQAFLSDRADDKRSRKIEELLERPAYVTWWTMKLCDLTGSNGGYLGSTEMAQPTAQQWRDWIERRVRDNAGYDEIARGLVAARSRRDGQSYADFIAEQSGYTRTAKPDDYAAAGNPMPHFWARSNVTQAKDKALSLGYTFLGVRLDCAECHKHPYDQWSQQDFVQFMRFFENIDLGQAPDAVEGYNQMRTRLGVPHILNTAASRRGSYLQIAAEGRPIPWSEIYIKPLSGKDLKSPPQARLLGAETISLENGVDPRAALLNWMLRKDNPYFARTFVNRIWANYFNVGIVHPPDDHNLANPPSNKALLDYLASGFINQGYDIKWLHREIANSRTYQLSWEPNETNAKDQRNFSRAVIRRLPAEVVIDGVIQSTANDRLLKTAHANVANRKIGQHPTSYLTRAIDYSLLIFGKPLRTTNCDCERQLDPTLLQALYIRNDRELFETLERKDGWLQQLAAEFKQPLSSDVMAAAGDAKPAESAETIDTATLERLVREAYLRTLSRSPTEEEVNDSLQHLTEAERPIDGLKSLMWALVNTQEFITNH